MELCGEFATERLEVSRVIWLYSIAISSVNVSKYGVDMSTAFKVFFQRSNLLLLPCFEPRVHGAKCVKIVWGCGNMIMVTRLISCI